MTVDRETKEVMTIVNGHADECARLRETKQAEEPAPTEPAEPDTTTREYTIACSILAIVLIVNIVLCVDHVIRTIRLALDGATFPRGWVAYDTLRCVVIFVVVIMCFVSYEVLNIEYNRERRCDYGVR
jgi:hypothetical protein